MLNHTISPLKWEMFIFTYYPGIYIIESFLKNITRKCNLKYMG